MNLNTLITNNINYNRNCCYHDSVTAVAASRTAPTWASATEARSSASARFSRCRSRPRFLPRRMAPFLTLIVQYCKPTTVTLMYNVHAAMWFATPHPAFIYVYIWLSCMCKYMYTNSLCLSSPLSKNQTCKRANKYVYNDIARVCRGLPCASVWNVSTVMMPSRCVMTPCHASTGSTNADSFCVSCV